MQNILSSKLWRVIRTHAALAKRREVAIAYVTKDLIGFRSGDVLICDASSAAVRSGETDAKLLVKLGRRGVELFSCAGLHAKVLLLDDVVVVGSGNMSASSLSVLVEAAIITDTTSIVSGVASLIEQLKRQSAPLDDETLNALAKIKVIRRGFRSGGLSVARTKKPRVSELGTRTWLVGVHEMKRDLTGSEEAMTNDTSRALAHKFQSKPDEITWIRWGSRGGFARKGLAGDQLLQIWSASARKGPQYVLKPAPVLLVRRHGRSTFVFIRNPRGRLSRLGWGRFKSLMKRLGYGRRFGSTSEVVLDSELAEAVSRSWANA